MASENERAVQTGLSFKDGLDKPGVYTDHQEQDWNALEQMLDKGKKPVGIVYWLPVVSSIAALLLLFLGWWFFKPQVVYHNPQYQQQVHIHRQQQNTGTNNKLITPTEDRKPQIPVGANYTNNSMIAKHDLKSSPVLTLPVNRINKYTTGQIAIPGRQNSEALTAVNRVVIDNSSLRDEGSTDLLLEFKGSVTMVPSSKQRNGRIKPRSSSHRQFALSVIASPDLNGVNSLQQTKLGGNVGLLFSAALSKKWTITTGAIYSVKPYTTEFQNYHTSYKFQTDPVNVMADCRVLDIPINVGYQFYNKQHNKISIGSGLSSYIMLRENYKFNYTNTYATGLSGYDVINKNQHILGILNINATYERQLNSKVGISVQPYMKLPLTNIGYSQVRLQTAGLAVGLSWNLNSSTKP